VIVDPAQAANCRFTFEAQIRKTVKCGIPCNQAQVTKGVADDIANQVKDIVVESAVDTTPNGLLGLIQAEGVDTTGLKSTAVVDTANVVYKSDPGVRIQLKVKTDDHPDETSWQLIDNCPVQSLVRAGGDYSDPGKNYSTTILNRKSRYLFVILDTGGDGICCNYGPEGYYEIYMDNVLQAQGGKFESSASAVFGACPGPTSKPTNVQTASPTNSPTKAVATLQPTVAVVNVDMKVIIKFDNFPEDISWDLRYTCNGGSIQKGAGGPYTEAVADKTEEVYNENIHDGTFMFTIRDSQGDGLCCTQGYGELTILYGSRKLSTPFENPASVWTLEFGTATKCP